MFRIDKSSVEYPSSSSPYLVTIIQQPGEEAPQASEQETPGATMPQPEYLKEKAAKTAERMIAEARAAAEKMKADAAGEAEAIKTKAYDEALKRGGMEAKKRAAEQERAGKEEIGRVLSALNESLQKSLDETVNNWEEELLDLSIEIARKIINVELERNEAAFKSLVQNALSHMRGDAKVTVHVSPREYEKYFQEGDVIFQLGGESVKPAIVEDPLLERGGCVVESEGEMINAGVEQQLKAMRSAMDKDEVS